MKHTRRKILKEKEKMNRDFITKYDSTKWSNIHVTGIPGEKWWQGITVRAGKMSRNI